MQVTAIVALTRITMLSVTIWMVLCYLQASQKSAFYILLDSDSNFVVVDSGNNRIRKITVATSMVSTIAGDDAISYNDREEVGGWG